jgi:hypothetical protein
VAECLPSKHKALSLTPNTPEKKERKGQANGRYKEGPSRNFRTEK